MTQVFRPLIRAKISDPSFHKKKSTPSFFRIKFQTPQVLVYKFQTAPKTDQCTLVCLIVIWGREYLPTSAFDISLFYDNWSICVPPLLDIVHFDAKCHGHFSVWVLRQNLWRHNCHNWYELVAFLGYRVYARIILLFSGFILIRICFSKLAPVRYFGTKIWILKKHHSKNLGPLKKIRKKLAPLIL